MVRRLAGAILVAFMLIALPSIAAAHDSAEEPRPDKPTKVEARCAAKAALLTSIYEEKKAELEERFAAKRSNPENADRQEELQARFERKMAQLDARFARKMAKLERWCAKFLRAKPRG